MRRYRAIALPFVCLSALACGGAVANGPDASSDADSDATIPSDAGYTKCSSPNGVTLCGGPEACGPTCPYCIGQGLGIDGGLRICAKGLHSGSGEPQQCPDGFILAGGYDGFPMNGIDGMECVPEDVGKLYALNGRLDLARFADRGAYVASGLPPGPTSCPTIPGLNLCGGACGECPDPVNQVCMGRSDRHPFSLCVNKFGKPNTPARCARGDAGTCQQGLGKNLRCLSFAVDAPSQLVADKFGMCVDQTICEAAATAYPGGAFCTSGALP